VPLRIGPNRGRMALALTLALTLPTDGVDATAPGNQKMMTLLGRLS
jgi:hypothetical protein